MKYRQKTENPKSGSRVPTSAEILREKKQKKDEAEQKQKRKEERERKRLATLEEKARNAMQRD